LGGLELFGGIKQPEDPHDDETALTPTPIVLTKLTTSKNIRLLNPDDNSVHDRSFRSQKLGLSW